MPVTPPPKVKRKPTKIPFSPRAPVAPRFGFSSMSSFNPNYMKSLGYNTVKSSTNAQPGYSQTGSTASAAPGLSASNQPYDYTHDPSYVNDMAAITQRYGIENSKVQLASSQDKIALDRAYSVMGADQSGAFKTGVYDTSGARQEGTIYSDRQTAQSNANKAGLFYSGQLGQNLGDINASYTNKVGELGSDFQGAELARGIQTRDIAGTYGPGGTAEVSAQNEAKQRAADIAGQQALIQALSASADTTSANGAPAVATPAAYAGASFANSPLGKSGPRGEMPVRNSLGTLGYYRKTDGKFIPF